jgi:AraC-like DNA-binding protein
MRHKVSGPFTGQMHSHHAIEIVYHPTGRGTTRVEGGRALAFREGAVVVYAPDERHDQAMDCDGEDLCVQLAVPRSLKAMTGSCFQVPLVEDAALIEDLRLLSRDHVRIAPVEQAILNLRATSTLLALIHLAFGRRDGRKADTTSSHVLKAEEYIRDHFSKIETLRQVAAHVGLSHDHLRHEFRAVRDKSMIRYLNEIRIERARTLLIHSGLTLGQIAGMCGFKDEYYFSAVFRKLAGLAPGRYRTVHRQAYPA